VGRGRTAPLHGSAQIGRAGGVVTSSAGSSAIIAVLATERDTSCDLPQVGFEVDQRFPAEHQLLNLLLHR
jgi:hypothetical protein